MNLLIKILAFSLLMLGSLSYSYGQQITVTGKVTAAEDNSPLPGLNIVVKGTTTGTITGIDGTYSIQVPDPENAILIFSFVGYKNQEIRVDDKKVINVEMEPESELLEEVVAIGYGVVKKRDLTGAVGVANVDEMKKSTSTTMAEALQGRMSGLTIKTSGQPGATAKIYVRGINSMFANTDPLYIIDGLPTNETRDFNPEDIESIQVLKDASSASIYGSRAANGVVIITTKRGMEGPVKIDFSAKFGVQNINKKYDLMDSREWLAFERLKYNNSGLLRPEIYDTTINTDWQDVMVQQGTVEDYNLSATGGTKNSNYMVSGNIFKNKGIVIGPEFRRASLRINGGVKKGKFKVEESLLLSTSDSKDLTGNPFNDAIRMVPLVPVQNPEGKYVTGDGVFNGPGTKTNGSNPVARTNLLNNTNQSYRMQGNLAMSYDIFDFLTYKITLGGELNQNIWQSKKKEGKWFENQSSASAFAETRNNWHHTVVENTLTFDKSFNDHNFNILGGYTEERTGFSDLSVSGDTIKRDPSGKYYWNVTAMDYVNPPGQSLSSSALRSFLARIMYNYKERYYFTASLRRDGSSNFSQDNRYGNFPSASVAWRVSEEPFFEPIELVNSLKVRASYGALGNQSIPSFLYEDFINSFQPYIFDGSGSNPTWGAIQISYSDPNIQWETQVSTNIGLDLALLNNAFSLTLDYFVTKSEKLLNQLPIPYYTGSESSSIWTNYGSVQNSGIEFLMNYKNYNDNLRFDVSLNGTFLKNEIQKLTNNNSPIYGPNSKTEVGRSLGEIFVLRTDGIYQKDDPGIGIDEIFGVPAKSGDERYLDLNGYDEFGNVVPGPDGKIDDADRTYVGSPWPKFEYGFNFNLWYKDFDFTLFIYGMQGRKVFNGANVWMHNWADQGNYISGLGEKSWTPSNPSNEFPMVTKDRLLRGNTDRFVENGSFLRLKNIQLGYTANFKALKNAGVSTLRIYVSAENLLTFSKYKGLDVDFSSTNPFGLGYDGGGYPNVRTISTGIQLSF